VSHGWTRTQFVRVCVTLIAGLMGLSAGATESTAIAVVPLLQALSLNTSTIDLGTLAEADFNLGYKEILTAQRFTLKSNSDWVVNISGNSALWSFTPSRGDLDPAKPCGDLEWKSRSTDPKVTSTSPNYAGVATTTSQVAAGNRGGSVAFDLDVRMLLAFAEDPPGNYSIAVTYTVTAP